MKNQKADCDEVVKFHKVVREELSENILEKGEEGATLIGARRSFPAEGRVRKDKGLETGKFINSIKKICFM